MVDWRDSNITSSIQAQSVREALDESKSSEYTEAKRVVSDWAETHAGAFQPSQFESVSTVGDRLQKAWRDYDSPDNKPLQSARGVFNKFWDRLVLRFEASSLSYHHVFEAIGDNLRLLAVTQPLEELLAKKLGTSGKPRLATLLERFSAWVEDRPERRQNFSNKGFRTDVTAASWTAKWPWRV